MRFTIQDLLLSVTVFGVLLLYELGWRGEVLGADDSFKSFWMMMAALALLFLISVSAVIRYIKTRPKRLQMSDIVVMICVSVAVFQTIIALLASPV